ncbi:hypothetical protein BKA65DRAFT_578991 [Rhexocercosporidium sp. MPI-PUGE-AT-0058]|nr:hypothetical protein BKA65DRAFT_578991 [Rhexocercosporidium sp. MPI-PUGE-AT-0058]
MGVSEKMNLDKSNTGWVKGKHKYRGAGMQGPRVGAIRRAILKHVSVGPSPAIFSAELYAVSSEAVLNGTLQENEEVNTKKGQTTPLSSNGLQHRSILHPKLPVEITLHIFTLAVTHHTLLKLWPVACNGPERFLHVDDTIRNVYPGYKQPLAVTAAINLALVSKAVNNLVVGEKLLYKNNAFTFVGAEYMLKYLGSITPERRKPIKSIKFTLDAGLYFANPGAALLMLGACSGLKHLTMNASLLFSFLAKPNANTFRKIPGMDILRSIRNLKTFKLVVSGNQDEYFKFHTNVHVYARAVSGGIQSMTANTMKAVDMELAEIEKDIREVVCSQGPDLLNVSEAEIDLGMAEIKLIRRYDPPPFTNTKLD